MRCGSAQTWVPRINYAHWTLVLWSCWFVARDAVDSKVLSLCKMRICTAHSSQKQCIRGRRSWGGALGSVPAPLLYTDKVANMIGMNSSSSSDNSPPQKMVNERRAGLTSASALEAGNLRAVRASAPIFDASTRYLHQRTWSAAASMSPIT